jgi:hypothetical protein
VLYGIFDAIKNYIGVLKGNANDKGATGVMVDEERGLVSSKHACVTNPATFDMAMSFVTKIGKAVKKNGATPDNGALLKLLAGRPAGSVVPLISLMESAGISPDELHAYCHYLHTEVQLQALMNVKLLSGCPFRIVSWKMPCISCVRLPLLTMKSVIWFEAHRLGITPEEGTVYPAIFAASGITTPIRPTWPVFGSPVDLYNNMFLVIWDPEWFREKGNVNQNQNFVVARSSAGRGIKRQ